MDKQAIIESIHEGLDKQESFHDDYIQSSDYASDYFSEKSDHFSSSDKEERIGKLLSHYDIPGHVKDMIETLGIEVKLFNQLYRDATPCYYGSIHHDDSHLDSAIIGECELDLGTFSNLRPDDLSDDDWTALTDEALSSYKGNVYVNKQGRHYSGYLDYDYEMIVLPVEKDDLITTIIDLFSEDPISSRIREAYKKDISSLFDWDRVKQEIRSSLAWDCDSSQFIGRCLLGSVFRLTPSGKVYAMWTTNQDEFDTTLDSLWNDALDSVLKDHHLFRDDHEENIFAADSWDIFFLPETQDGLDAEGISFLTAEDRMFWAKDNEVTDE